MEVQLGYYPGTGERYVAHRDAFAQPGGAGPSQRRITTTLYLNPDWRDEDGGQLRIHDGDRVTDVEPRAGRLVTMRSEQVMHEVLPARAPRFALTAWFYAP
jgi:SM-20-related protein